MITAPNIPATDGAWLNRLKAAVDAGYYCTEEAHSEQISFPWQGKHCKDCPFWSWGVCRVHMEGRTGMSHTCRFFDPANEPAARALIRNAGRLDGRGRAA